MPGGTQVASLYASIGADLSGINKGLKQSQSKLKTAARKITKVGKVLTLGITVPLLGIGTAAVKSAGMLDTEMRNIQSVSKQTDEEIDALAGQFLRMSADISMTTDSAAGLAAGFYDIQGSGFAGADGMKVLKASTMAASAGLTETAVASKAVTAKLNAYGDSADNAAHTSDVMFRTVDIGVGTFQELAGAMGTIVGTSAQAGIEFETVAAALATMSKAGIGFEAGATALNQLIVQLIKPTEDLAEAIKETGHRSGQALLDAEGLAGALALLVDVSGGGTEGLAALGLNSRSLRAALALTRDEMDPFNRDLLAMGDASGAAEEAFRIQSESFDAQMKNLKNTLETALIPAGTIMIRDVLVPMAQELAPVIVGVSELDTETLKLALRLGAVAAVAGPAITIMGKLASAALAIKAGAIGAANAALLLALELGPLTGAASAVGVGLLAAGSQSRTFNQDLVAIEKQIRGQASTYDGYITQMGQATDELMDLWKTYGVVGDEIELMDRGIVKNRDEWGRLRKEMGKFVFVGAQIKAYAHDETAALKAWADATGEVAVETDNTRTVVLKSYDVIRNASQRVIAEEIELNKQQKLRLKELAIAEEEAAEQRIKAMEAVARAAEAFGSTMSTFYGSWQDMADKVAGAEESLADKLSDLRGRESEELARANARRASAIEGYGEAVSKAEEKVARARSDTSRQYAAEDLAELQANQGTRLGEISGGYANETAVIRAEYAERRAIAEEAHQEELKRIQQAQQDQLLAATLGLMEQRGLLERFYGDYGDTAQEAQQGIEAGWLQITPEMAKIMGKTAGEITGQFDTINENLAVNAMEIGKVFGEALSEAIMTTDEVAAEAALLLQGEQTSAERESERVMAKLAAMEEETLGNMETSVEAVAVTSETSFAKISTAADSTGEHVLDVRDDVDTLQSAIDALHGKDIYIHLHTVRQGGGGGPQPAGGMGPEEGVTFGQGAGWVGVPSRSLGGSSAPTVIVVNLDRRDFEGPDGELDYLQLTDHILRQRLAY